jgi:putative transposase
VRRYHLRLGARSVALPSCSAGPACATDDRLGILRQYVSIRYTEHLAEAGIEPSVGSKGDSNDNAVAETINELYKAELIYFQSWRNREAANVATLKGRGYWYKHQRLPSSIGYFPLVEAEEHYHWQKAAQAIVA